MEGMCFQGSFWPAGKAEEEVRGRQAKRDYRVCAPGHQHLQSGRRGEERDAEEAPELLKVTLNAGLPQGVPICTLALPVSAVCPPIVQSTAQSQVYLSNSRERENRKVTQGGMVR